MITSENNSNQALTQEMLDRFGYVVIGSREPLKLGQLIDFRECDMPFNGFAVVVAKATRQEFCEQAACYGNLEPFEFPHHYRVKAE